MRRARLFALALAALVEPRAADGDPSRTGYYATHKDTGRPFAGFVEPVFKGPDETSHILARLRCLNHFPAWQDVQPMHWHLEQNEGYLAYVGQDRDNVLLDQYTSRSLLLQEPLHENRPGQEAFWWMNITIGSRLVRPLNGPYNTQQVRAALMANTHHGTTDYTQAGLQLSKSANNNAATYSVDGNGITETQSGNQGFLVYRPQQWHRAGLATARITVNFEYQLFVHGLFLHADGDLRPGRGQMIEATDMKRVREGVGLALACFTAVPPYLRPGFHRKEISASWQP